MGHEVAAFLKRGTLEKAKTVRRLASHKSVGFDQLDGYDANPLGRESAGDQAFLHRGIASRGFVRSFVLADGLEVEGATLEHGLLHVDLKRPEEAATVKRIPISLG